MIMTGGLFNIVLHGASVQNPHLRSYIAADLYMLRSNDNAEAITTTSAAPKVYSIAQCGRTLDLRAWSP